MRTAISRAPLAGRAVISFAIAAVLGAIGLALAGAGDQRTTAFSLDVPPMRTVASLRPGQGVCQRLIPAAADFSGVRFSVGRVPVPGTTLRVSATPAGRGATPGLGTAAVRTTRLTGSSTAQLSHAISGGSTVSLCLRNLGSRAVALMGDSSTVRSGTLTGASKLPGMAATMVFLRPHSSSLLSELPTIFKRAALFRPNWVGAWTFWLLLLAVVAVFPLTAFALWLATRDGHEPDG